MVKTRTKNFTDYEDTSHLECFVRARKVAPKEGLKEMSRLYEPYIRKRDDLAEEQRRSCQGGSGKRVADAVFPALCKPRVQSFLRELIYTISTAMSAGETPEMRPACPRFSGRILFSFCRASSRRPLICS